MRPTHVIAVDTGSVDQSPALLEAAYGPVLTLPRGTAFADAVAAGLDAAPRSTWVWLLHDDAAPDPDALEHLLAADPDAAVRGPKQLDWDDPGRLVEVGLSSDGAGRRLTGLDRGELDQGQHDSRRVVLAIGTAGALVRRDVWEALGGLDPALPLREDLDLGRRVWAAGHRVVVVPPARLRHARATATGQRRAGRVVAQDLRAGAYALLANATAAQLGPALVRLVLGSVLRALALLLGRRPRAALDELAALTPRGVGRARRARRRTRTTAVPRHLLSSPAVPVRAALAGLAERLASPGRRTRRPGPGVLLVVALAVLTLTAERALLGAGPLAGGRLLPAPPGAFDLLRSFGAGGDPALAVLGLLSLLTLGRAPLAVDVLLLASVPLAGAVAYAVSGRVVQRTALRLWAAATWAVLPVATGAVAGGRLDAAAVQICLPAVLLGGQRVATTDPRRRWQRAWALGLALAALTAISPLAWALAIVLLPATALLSPTPARVQRLLATVVVCAVPLALGAVVLTLHGPGRLAPELVDRALAAWQLLLLHPGGPGLPARAVTAGLLVGALAALLRPGPGAHLVTAGWALAGFGLVAALALARVDVDGGPVWPGVGLQLAAAGLLLAALVGADGLPEQLQRNALGTRQVAAVAVVAVAAAVPVLCAVAWVVRGADGPVQRGQRTVLPAFVRAELAETGQRALVVSPQPDGSVRYAVTTADGPRLGERPPPQPSAAVADLLSARGTDGAGRLADASVRYVVLVGGDSSDEAVLDAQPGLLRQAGPPLWQVSAPAGPRPEPDGRRLWPQVLVLAGVVVLAGPGGPRRRGLERQP